MPLNKYKFSIKRNDTYPALVVNVFGRGRLYERQDFNLTNVSAVTFSMMNEECEEIKIASKQAQITCYTGGTIQYNWSSEDTDEAGMFLGEFELFFNGGGKMSLPQVGGIQISINEDISIG